MKTRNGFVSNSSSTSFIITNKTKKVLTIVDFVKENPQLIKEFLEHYDWYKENPKFTQENLIKSAKENTFDLQPEQEQVCVFGDEQDTLIGHIFDYMLRDGGESKSFSWKFKKYNR